MVKLIMGLKGAGKTKQVIELVNKAVLEESGDIVCIEKGRTLRYDIPHTVRLIDSSQYDFNCYDFFKGFICGLYSANYDITHIYVDSVHKIIGEEPEEKIEDFLDWCARFSERENVNFTITITADATKASDGLKKYF